MKIDCSRQTWNRETNGHKHFLSSCWSQNLFFPKPPSLPNLPYLIELPLLISSVMLGSVMEVTGRSSAISGSVSIGCSVFFSRSPTLLLDGLIPNTWLDGVIRRQLHPIFSKSESWKLKRMSLILVWPQTIFGFGHRIRPLDKSDHLTKRQ